MFCRTCDYPLWNLKTNRCPECGNGFDWRDYHFKPGSVSVGCPNCGHSRTDLQTLAPLTTVTCEACGQSVAVEAMSVAPLTDNPWDATALPDVPAPPFKVFSAGFWCLVVLTLIELPGIAVAFLPYLWGVSPWEALHALPALNHWPEVPFLAGILVTAGALRSLLPWRWTRVELAGAWLAVVVMLGMPLIVALILAALILAGGRQLTPDLYAILIVPPCLLVAMASSILLQRRWRIPWVYVAQLSLRAVFLSGPVILLLIHGIAEIGSVVTLYLVIVYGLVLILSHLLMWRLTRRRRLQLQSRRKHPPDTRPARAE